MAEDGIILAIGRLERAVARVEAVTRTPAGDTSGPLADLTARHERLRAGTAAALARLDRLIADGKMP